VKRVYGIPVRRPLGWIPRWTHRGDVLPLLYVLLIIGIGIGAWLWLRAKADRCEEKGGVFFYREGKCITGDNLRRIDP